MVDVGLFTIVSLTKTTVKPPTVVGGDVFTCCFFDSVLCGAHNYKIMMRWGSTDAGYQNRFCWIQDWGMPVSFRWIELPRASGADATMTQATHGRCSCARAHHVVREHHRGKSDSAQERSGRAADVQRESLGTKAGMHGSKNFGWLDTGHDSFCMLDWTHCWDHCVGTLKSCASCGNVCTCTYTWAMKRNLVVWVVQEVIGFIISYYRHLYEAASILESSKGSMLFFLVANCLILKKLFLQVTHCDYCFSIC